MFDKISHFIKYNNATVLILALIFAAGGGVFAQTDAGQEFIGTEKTRIEGRDNTLLIEADLENFNPDYTIEKIDEDEKYFYVTYTAIELVETDTAWEYQLNEKVRKVSKKLREDLGKYLARELAEESGAALKDLKREQAKARSDGAQTRVEVTEYTGLMGKTLSIAERIFPGYEAVKTRELPQPGRLLSLPKTEYPDEAAADDLAAVYEDYIARMDPDGDNILGVLDNCPDASNPDQSDRDGDGSGDQCDEFFTLEPVLEETAASTSPEENAASTSPEEAGDAGVADDLTVEIIELGDVATGT